MRRMRFAWYHVLFILPALALAFGIQYQIRKNHQEPSSTELAVVKPSYFHVDSKTPATSAPGAATAVTAKAGAGAPAKASGASTTAVAGTPTAAGLKTRAAITAGAVPGAATTTGVVAGAATVERAARPAARFLQKLGELAAALPAGDGPVFEDLPSPNANVVVPQKKPSRKALAQAPAASAPAAQGQPAQSHEDAAVAPAPGAGRALAAAQGQMKMAKSAQVPVAPRTAAAAQPPVHAAMDPQEPRQAPIVETPSAVPTQPLVLAPAPEAPAQSFLTGADTPYSTQDQGRNICSSIEYRGEGPAAVPTQEEWAEFMATFHEVKRELAQWLQKNRGGLSAETVDAMQQRLSAVRAYRPPVLDEPDLAWRGIGVWSTADATTDPALR
ncbi:MAG: hypothetical protein NDJ90_11060, partial [Oligoflexia bacterium]|nr:hypothetical protein [Oligoflexia bacterium]